MKKLSALVLASLFISILSAQSRTASTEFGLGIGSLNYAGEIATTRSTSALLTEVRPNFIALAKRNFNHRFAMGMEVSYGFIYASDENHSNPGRKLAVTTSLLQVNPFLELNLIEFGKFHYHQKFGMYIKAGGGLIAYNPDPEIDEVFPSGFDPEPNAYTGMNIFGAAGLRFRVGYKAVLNLEASLHSTTVDNLDGVIQNSGDTGANDTYGGFKVVFTRMFF